MPEVLEEVIQFLQESEVVLVIVGAGLSRPSGLPTFREDPGFWGHAIEEIATKVAFDRNPAQVWNLYERMRRLALDATPNEGHLALARLSKAKPSCLTITQNIDELSTDAGHELGTLQTLHGSLFDLKCANDACTFKGRNVDRRTFDLLVCPECRLSYLRPGVTWFGERLPLDVVQKIDAWLEFHERIDMVLVVGTERTPYLHDALLRGAKVAWFNKMEGHVEDMGDADWVVDGDASMTLPYVIDSALAGVPEHGLS
ncbi:hypothetical protein LTR56_025666 [Elasticomyces elasticus]|nr:hypothetical protein LTR56_025666 [Elasticomyces elasticus]KAK5738993.1 hypothetical protein LTS12_025409 [Elasticomyces elasticus]